MKKFKKAMAVLITGAMLNGWMLPVSVGAESIEMTPDEKLFAIVQEGQQMMGNEKFEDYGLMRSVPTEGSAEDGWQKPYEYAYTAYWAIDCHSSAEVMYDYQFNKVEIVAEQSSPWREIYEKYCDELAFDCEDVYVRDSGVNAGCEEIYLYDRLDEHGETIADKLDLIQDMCTEMYASGLIEKAYYTSYFARTKRADFGEAPYRLRVWHEDVDTDAFYDIVKEVGDQITVGQIAETENGKQCYLENIQSMEEMLDLAKNLSAAYPDVNFCVSVRTIALEMICEDERMDLLENLPDLVHYGDVNQDGKVSVLDAILLSKAAVQVVRLNETQTTAGDFNGDGVVNTEDVTLLLMYLVDKIDTLPVAAV